MKERVLLGLVLLYSIVSRFWFLGTFPPLISPSSFPPRFFSATLSVMSILLVYLYTRKAGYEKKTVLISAFLLASLAWSIEQGRIASQPNNAVAIFLLFFTIGAYTKNFFFKIILYGCIPLVLFIFYPQFWLLKTITPNTHFLENIFTLLSPDFLFFHNITFWWGGVREVGVLYFSLLPFFLAGLYSLIFSTGRDRLFFLIGILVVSAASPFFPESREFFLALPLLCIIVAEGVRKVFSQKGNLVKWGSLIFTLLIVYEMMQFFHYYTVHHSQQVEGNKNEIHEAF